MNPTMASFNAYQCKNLLSFGATIHSQTPAEDSDHKAENLIENLESRSSTNSYNALTDDNYYSPNYASYYSCYVTNQDAIAADGDQVKVVFDLQIRSFIHAVLMIDDLKDSDAWTYLSDTDKLSYLQNLEIYIGDDSENATNNNRCQGGPFLDIDDTSNYSEDQNSTNTSNLRPWNYGVESWCNLEGRFVHLVANLSHQNGQIFTQSICRVGIFGTIYQR